MILLKSRFYPFSILSKVCLLVVMAFFLASCAKGPQEESVYYFNDFENLDLNEITNGSIVGFNGSRVLGRYNNGGFKLQLDNLPSHDMLEISFDLYLHDSWDGVLNGDNLGGPDIWQMYIDGNIFIDAAFSNQDCPVQTCVSQSYPANYPNSNNAPKTGAYRRDLPGYCHLAGQIGGSSQYKIVKKIRHNGNLFTLECMDKLKQLNATSPICDESWSVDNIKVKLINLK